MASDADVTPSELRFRFQLNKQLLSTISINNVHQQRLAFKVKTTAPKKYVVRPSSGVVDPKSSTSIQVIMQAQKEYPADFAACKDKFMVQTTLLGEEEQIDKDTFVKESRANLKETRLRVLMEGPAAPPSPVPEANEADETLAEPRAADQHGSSSETRLRTTLGDLSAVSQENTSLKSMLDRLTKERDELRRKLDYIELQSNSSKPAPAAAPAETALKFRVTIVHIVLAAILAFLIGHYT